MKKILPLLLKQEGRGLFKRAAMRSALVVFKPAVRKAVEGDYSHDDIMALTGAHMRVLMPDFKFNSGKTHQRAIDAIEAKKIANAEYAKDPFLSPTAHEFRWRSVCRLRRRFR